MDITSLDFKNLEKVTSISFEKRRASLYKNNIKYYKVWNHNLKIGPYFILDKFNLIHYGYDDLIGKKLNLINSETCCAFDDLIFHKNYCCGYSTFSGIPLSLNSEKYKNKYLEFIEKLVSISIENNYFIPDVGIHNIIEYDNKLSLIDIDFIPISIEGYKKLSSEEQLHIDKYIMTGNFLILSGFMSCNSKIDSLYLHGIKEKIF